MDKNHRRGKRQIWFKILDGNQLAGFTKCKVLPWRGSQFNKRRIAKSKIQLTQVKSIDNTRGAKVQKKKAENINTEQKLM